MKRDITFVGPGNMATALGLDRERCAEFDEIVRAMIEEGKSLAEIITHMNDRGDLSDAEWTTLIHCLGYMDGWNHRE